MVQEMPHNENENWTQGSINIFSVKSVDHCFNDWTQPQQFKADRGHKKTMLAIKQ